MWVFEGKPITCHADLFKECRDIVYVLTYESGKQYIGKKTVRSIRKLKPTKAMLAKRKNAVRRELVDVPFMSYEGSSKDTEGEIVVSKEILHQSSNKLTATYLESYYLFREDVIVNDAYLNQNIGGKFFDSALNGLLDYNER